MLTEMEVVCSIAFKYRTMDVLLAKGITCSRAKQDTAFNLGARQQYNDEEEEEEIERELQGLKARVAVLEELRVSKLKAHIATLQLAEKGRLVEYEWEGHPEVIDGTMEE